MSFQIKWILIIQFDLRWVFVWINRFSHLILKRICSRYICGIQTITNTPKHLQRNVPIILNPNIILDKIGFKHVTEDFSILNCSRYFVIKFFALVLLYLNSIKILDCSWHKKLLNRWGKIILIVIYRRRSRSRSQTRIRKIYYKLSWVASGRSWVFTIFPKVLY